MALPHWSLSDDATRLYVDFPTQPTARFEFDAEEVDDFIAHLVEMRAAMQPAVPMADPDPGTRVLTGTTGRYYVQPYPSEGRMVIAFLHPGLRWVGMLFGRKEAEQFLHTIRHGLQRLSDTQ
jgi:hypothetical protein